VIGLCKRRMNGKKCDGQKTIPFHSVRLIHETAWMGVALFRVD
jgi:hypothetical protein